ncbi:MAG TPA: hypothetical protein VIU37_07885, partial [Candidatus Limnocylindrales bacterium]
GTVLLFRALAATGQAGPPSRTRPARSVARSVRVAVEATAAQLGNTPAVARSAYVHPAVIDAYLDGGVRDAIVEAADVNPVPPRPPSPAEERAVLRLIGRRARREQERHRSARAGRRHAMESQGR